MLVAITSYTAIACFVFFGYTNNCHNSSSHGVIIATFWPFYLIAFLILTFKEGFHYLKEDFLKFLDEFKFKD